MPSSFTVFSIFIDMSTASEEDMGDSYRHTSSSLSSREIIMPPLCFKLLAHRAWTKSVFCDMIRYFLPLAVMYAFVSSSVGIVNGVFSFFLRSVSFFECNPSLWHRSTNSTASSGVNVTSYSSTSFVAAKSALPISPILVQMNKIGPYIWN